jgi:hypothetical protein
MNASFAPGIKAQKLTGGRFTEMQVGAIQQDRRTEVAGRPNDVRTHIGVPLR